MKTNLKTFKVLLLGIILIALMEGVSAQTGVNDTESSNVTVTVSAVTMIDVAPASFSYTADPGEACGVYLSGGLCNETVENYYALQVENIGSWNITRVWFNVSQPTQSPFAVGNNSFVDPGNFVQLTWNDTSNDWFYVDRKEFPEAKTIVYLRDPDGSMPANLTKYNYGRFRNASREYFYMLKDTTGDACVVGEMTWIRVGTRPRTQDEIGSTDFSAPKEAVDWHQINLTALTTYAVGNISVGPLTGYVVAVQDATCNVRFSKWNKDFPFDGANNANYSFNGVLTPGDSLAKRIGVLIDYGIYTGTKTGYLTAIAEGAV